MDPTVVFGYKDQTAGVGGSTRYFDPLIDQNENNYQDNLENDYQDYPDDYDDEDYDDEDDDDEDDGRKRSYVVPIMLAVTVAVVIIASLVIAYYAISNFGPGATHTGNVTIPNFVGQNIVQVEQEYKDKLVFEKTEEYSNEYEEGIIMWQSQTGKTVREGFTLQVTVSKGQRLITVPNMVNKDAEVARSEITSAGFTPIVTEIYDDNVAKGMVVKTEPEAGTEYPEGKEVKIFVSQGPFETQVKVPNVVGMTQSKAIAKLKESKLDYEVQEQKHDGDKGKVVDQSEAEGTYVDRGTKVIIYVSTGETDPIDLTLRIPMPSDGLHGAYTIDVFRDGSVAYTKTISNGETVMGGTVSIEISGKKTETLIIYIRNNESNGYIRYATYNIDYDKETIELSGSLAEDKLKEITPAETTTTPTLPEESIPDTQPADSQPDANSNTNQQY